ncbi:MAG: guanylate kinase [Lachnospiraceae bacterium]|nr:guanylate kinase [Lachnospiraceae bacterium]
MICIIGKSASGKTLLVERLIQNGYKKAVTYTTRPMRPGEVEGVDYFFISKEDFEKKVSEGFFAEYYDFTKEGRDGWMYGSSKESYLQADNKTIIILTPRGVQAVRESGVPLKVIYLKVSKKCRFNASLLRQDNIEEVKRRIEKDEIDFADAESLSDLVINNDHFELNPIKLSRLVEKYA